MGRRRPPRCAMLRLLGRYSGRLLCPCVVTGGESGRQIQCDGEHGGFWRMNVRSHRWVPTRDRHHPDFGRIPQRAARWNRTHHRPDIDGQAVHVVPDTRWAPATGLPAHVMDHGREEEVTPIWLGRSPCIPGCAPLRRGVARLRPEVRCAPSGKPGISRV